MKDDKCDPKTYVANYLTKLVFIEEIIFLVFSMTIQTLDLLYLYFYSV